MSLERLPVKSTPLCLENVEFLYRSHDYENLNKCGVGTMLLIASHFSEQKNEWTMEDVDKKMVDTKLLLARLKFTFSSIFHRQFLAEYIPNFLVITAKIYGTTASCCKLRLFPSFPWNMRTIAPISRPHCHYCRHNEINATASITL
jgi:hypothetical protein